jgi:2-polyprenyl-6-methoxyphenol hydroxylase-like FAD-dependent oxidoreductase
LRARSGLEVEDIGAPMDVLWFRVGKRGGDDELFARVDRGRMMVTIDRGDYWQCAYVIAKGGFDAVRARGLDAFRADVVAISPVLGSGIAELRSWDHVKLLTVAIDRLRRWALPGLLCIGDAAHAMSPVGGVGVNLAVQDAVAAANLLAEPLLAGAPSLDDLMAVQRRRAFPTRATQKLQVLIQNTVIASSMEAGGPVAPPLAARIADRVPAIRGLAARLIGIGLRPEHVRSPEARLAHRTGPSQSGCLPSA